MFSGIVQPQAAPGVQASIAGIEPLGSRDAPCYYSCNQAMMIGNSGTVAANANAGNMTLGTALDQIYGPTNNGIPGIWAYLPATALAAPNNVAGWYWMVMTSTTVGTVYAITYVPGTSFPYGLLSQAQASAVTPNTPPGLLLNQVAGGAGFTFQPTVPASSQLPTLPAGGINSILVPAFPDAPPPSMVVAANIATGSGSGYTGVTTETAAVAYPLQGGAIGPTGSMIFEGLVNATNSGGTKTYKGKIATAASLTNTGNQAVVTGTLTTGVSAFITRTFVMWDGHVFNTGAGTTNSGKFMAAGSNPTAFTMDESGGAAGTTPLYAGYTVQVGVATDWIILQGHYLTGNQA